MSSNGGEKLNCFKEFGKTDDIAVLQREIATLLQELYVRCQTDEKHLSFGQVLSAVPRSLRTQASSSNNSTPFEATKVANRRAFSGLQEEVDHLKRQLELSLVENNKLMERLGVDEGEGEATLLNLTDGSIQAGHMSFITGLSHSPGVAALVKAACDDSELLHRQLSESRARCRLLRGRLEELMAYLHKLLPLVSRDSTAPVNAEDLKSCLDSTFSLLANITVQPDEECETLGVSQLEKLLARNLDGAMTDELTEKERRQTIGGALLESRLTDTGTKKGCTGGAG